MSDTTTTDVTGEAGAPVVILHGLDGLRERAGERIGTSGWKSVEQQDIDTFAALTGDEQWIHTDPERAKLTYEVEGEPKPCCVADLVFRYYA